MPAPPDRVLRDLRIPPAVEQLPLPTYRPRARGDCAAISRGRGRSTLLVALLFAWITPAARAAEFLIVRSNAAAPYAQAADATRAALAAAGPADTVRTALAKEMLDGRMADVVGKADVVIAIGTPAAAWLHKNLPAGTRLVYCMVPGPKTAGLLEGRQATGVTTEVPLADQLRLATETLPNARTIGLLYRSDTPDGRAQLAALKDAAGPLGLGVTGVAVNDHPSVAAAIDALTNANVDLAWTTADQTIYDQAGIRALLLAGLRKRVPVWGFSPAFVRAGALVGVGVEPAAQGAQAATIARTVLKDPAAAAKARAVAPEKFDVAVNLIVASQIGVSVPEPVVRRATQVFRPEPQP